MGGWPALRLFHNTTLWENTIVNSAPFASPWLLPAVPQDRTEVQQAGTTTVKIYRRDRV